MTTPTPNDPQQPYAQQPQQQPYEAPQQAPADVYGTPQQPLNPEAASITKNAQNAFYVGSAALGSFIAGIVLNFLGIASSLSSFLSFAALVGGIVAWAWGGSIRKKAIAANLSPEVVSQANRARTYGMTVTIINIVGFVFIIIAVAVFGMAFLSMI